MFGRKKKKVTQIADSDRVERVFSKELFQGEIGDALREAGITPDMPDNIIQRDAGGTVIQKAGPKDEALNYYVRYEPIFTRAVFDHPRIGPAVSRIARIDYDMRGNQIPLFAFEPTVMALHLSSDDVKKSVLDAGFGLMMASHDVTARSDFMVTELEKMIDSNAEDENKRIAILRLHQWMGHNIKGVEMDQSGQLSPKNIEGPQTVAPLPPFQLSEAQAALALAIPAHV